MNERIPDKPVIWIIDRQQWPRAYLRAELMERGLDAIGFAELTPALETLSDPHSARPRIIVLDLFALSFGRDELDALTRPGISVIVLGGAAELDQPLVQGFKWEAVIRRPFTIGEIADAVQARLDRPEKENKK